jgi:AcrR family transcriptional regulator
MLAGDGAQAMKNNGFPTALYTQIFNVKPGRGEERKIRIVKTMIECLASKGLEETTFDVLGKKLKMRRTHVAYYFANRDELVMAAIRYVVAVGQSVSIEHSARAKDWRGRMKAVIEGPFEWLTQNPEHACVMTLLYNLASHSKPYRELQSTIRNMGEERMVSCLEPSGIAVAKAREIARAVQAMMTGYLVGYFSSEYPIPLPKLKAQVVKLSFEWIDAELS